MTLSKFFAVSCLSLALVACGQGDVSAKTAAQMVSSDAKLATVKNNVEDLYKEQNLKVISVADAPMKGWYEVVVMGNQIIYVDDGGQYMMVGDLIDMKSKRSLTEDRNKDLNRVDFASLPLEKAIKEVRGNGQMKVAVFTDPKCPYCHKLEKEFEQMTDITIYNFMLPFQPGGDKMAENIWCQDDSTKAWVDWMRKGVEPSQKTCENPIAETASLGQQLGFNGTPAIVFPNGKTQSGYSPKEYLEQAIKDNQQ